MEIYGYQQYDDTLLNLKEISLLCTIDELDNVIRFLTDVKENHASVVEKTNLCHSHLRDWDCTWSKDKPDIIVVTKFESK